MMNLQEAESLLRDLTANSEELLLAKTKDPNLIMAVFELVMEEPIVTRTRSDTDLILILGLAAQGLVYLLKRRLEAQEMNKTVG